MPPAPLHPFLPAPSRYARPCTSQGCLAARSTWRQLTCKELRLRSSGRRIPRLSPPWTQLAPLTHPFSGSCAAGMAMARVFPHHVVCAMQNPDWVEVLAFPTAPSTPQSCACERIRMRRALLAPWLVRSRPCCLGGCWRDGRRVCGNWASVAGAQQTHHGRRLRLPPCLLCPRGRASSAIAAPWMHHHAGLTCTPPTRNPTPYNPQPLTFALSLQHLTRGQPQHHDRQHDFHHRRHELCKRARQGLRRFQTHTHQLGIQVRGPGCEPWVRSQDAGRPPHAPCARSPPPSKRWP